MPTIYTMTPQQIADTTERMIESLVQLYEQQKRLACAVEEIAGEEETKQRPSQKWQRIDLWAENAGGAIHEAELHLRRILDTLSK